MMEYRGYIAKVEYDDSGGMLHGEVINAAPYPIVTFEASDVDGLKREFHGSIDKLPGLVRGRRGRASSRVLRQDESSPGTRPAPPGVCRGRSERPEHQRMDNADHLQGD